jgi:hypothetical protein
MVFKVKKIKWKRCYHGYSGSIGDRIVCEITKPITREGKFAKSFDRHSCINGGRYYEGSNKTLVKAKRECQKDIERIMRGLIHSFIEESGKIESLLQEDK